MHGLNPRTGSEPEYASQRTNDCATGSKPLGGTTGLAAHDVGMQKSFLHASGPGSRGELLTGTSHQIVEALIDLHFGEGVDRPTAMRAIAVVAATRFQAESMQRASAAGTFSLAGCTMAEIDRLTRDRTITDRDPTPWLRRDVPLVLVHPGTEMWQPPTGNVMTLECQSASVLLLGLARSAYLRVGAISI